MCNACCVSVGRCALCCVRLWVGMCALRVGGQVDVLRVVCECG